MHPWLWLYAPQLNLPLSGGVAQDIHPATWFEQHIPAQAGSAQIEAQATQVASYGTQLGLLTDLMLALTQAPATPLNAAQQASRQALDQISQQIDGIKQLQKTQALDELNRLAELLARLQAQGGPAHEAAVQRLQPLLVPRPGPLA